MARFIDTRRAERTGAEVLDTFSARHKRWPSATVSGSGSGRRSAERYRSCARLRRQPVVALNENFRRLWDSGFRVLLSMPRGERGHACCDAERADELPRALLLQVGPVHSFSLDETRFQN